jgi:hypothetical protein
MRLIFLTIFIVLSSFLYGIDAGDPEIFDPDGTPSDIGAVCAIEHRVDAIELIDMAEGVNWKSFPVLDDITTDGDIAANVLYDIMQPPYPAALNLVETQGGWYDIIFEYPYWNNDNLQFTSDKGYKIHMNNEYTIEITGFLEDRYHILNLESGIQNWLGYFVEYSMKPLDAFEAVLDKIDMIKTRDFSLVKIQGEWFGTCEWTINYGDLVIVNCTEDGSFYWGEDGGGGVDKMTRSPSQDFVYTEEADYIPVIVELDTEALGNPSEIGIFVDDECKGAEVIPDSVVQIRAYVFGDTIAFDPGEVSFQLSYGTRAENRILNNYSVKMDPGEKGKKETLDFSKKRKRYYLISLKDTDGVEPEIIATSLGVNYPNPFNPVTTIKYSLANQGQVELAVYNIKGQKVRTLVNKVQESGQYQVIWDGTNGKCKPAASGIYLYRMSTADKILHKKMLLMK